MSTKSIVAEVALVPNYLFHLLAVARAGYDSDYADRHRTTIREDDLRFLEQHRQLLSFGEGSGGALCSFALFMPIMLDLDNRGSIDEMFRLVLESLRAGNCDRLFERYRHKCEQLHATWFAPTPAEISACGQHSSAVERYADIVYRNWNNYQLQVWPAECRNILNVAATINEHFGKANIIADWERLTGREYRAARCKILLCSALANGPNANSMGYDRIVFWSGKELAWTLDFISHEVGTHLLIDILRTLRDDPDIEWNSLYAAYESLCRYLNTLVLGREPVYKIEQFRFGDYARLYAQLIPDPAHADLASAVKAAAIQIGV